MMTGTKLSIVRSLIDKSPGFTRYSPERVSEDVFVGAESKTVSPLFNVALIEEPSRRSSLAIAKIAKIESTPYVPAVPFWSIGRLVPLPLSISETPNFVITGASVSMLMLPTVTLLGSAGESGLLPASVVLFGSIASTFKRSVLCPARTV